MKSRRSMALSQRVGRIVKSFTVFGRKAGFRSPYMEDGRRPLICGTLQKRFSRASLAPRPSSEAASPST
jgi:hypothetical protein